MLVQARDLICVCTQAMCLFIFKALGLTRVPSLTPPGHYSPGSCTADMHTYLQRRNCRKECVQHAKHARVYI